MECLSERELGLAHDVVGFCQSVVSFYAHSSDYAFNEQWTTFWDACYQMTSNDELFIGVPSCFVFNWI